MVEIDEDKFKAEALKAVKDEAKAKEQEAKAEEEKAEAEKEEAEAIKEKAKAVGKAGLESGKAGWEKIKSHTSVGGAMAGAGMNYLAGKGKSWFSPTDVFLILSFLSHYFLEIRNSDPTFILVLNIVIGVFAWILLFKASPEKMPIILLVFGLEIGLPLIAEAFPFLLEIYGLKWVFVSQLWPWWSYMALIIGERTKFNQFILIIVVLFWIFFLVQQGNFMQNYVSTASNLGSEETEKFRAEAKKLSTSSLGYFQAWWECHMPPKQNCTKYKELTGEIEVIKQTGEEIDITPTMVELEIEKENNVFTASYLQNTGLGLAVDIIRGNDKTSINGKINCSFKNETLNLTGFASPNEFSVGEEVLAGTHTTNSLCKSDSVLNKGNYKFMSEISFNQETYSALKNYFMNKKVPETNSLRKAPFYQKILVTKMNKGMMEIDLSLNRRSPIKIDMEENTFLPLQILFLNKGKGKIKNISDICLKTTPPLYVKNLNGWDYQWEESEKIIKFCMKENELPILNYQLEEQEKLGQIPRHVEELEINPNGIPEINFNENNNFFPNTNNPFDLNIDIIVKYTYSLEEETNFKII